MYIFAKTPLKVETHPFTRALCPLTAHVFCYTLNPSDQGHPHTSTQPHLLKISQERTQTWRWTTCWICSRTQGLSLGHIHPNPEEGTVIKKRPARSASMSATPRWCSRASSPSTACSRSLSCPSKDYFRQRRHLRLLSCYLLSCYLLQVPSPPGDEETHPIEHCNDKIKCRSLTNSDIYHHVFVAQPQPIPKAKELVINQESLCPLRVAS